jgi:hypothetical protein
MCCCQKLSPQQNGTGAIPNAIETIEQLRQQGIKLALLTNGNAEINGLRFNVSSSLPYLTLSWLNKSLESANLIRASTFKRWTNLG